MNEHDEIGNQVRSVMSLVFGVDEGELPNDVSPQTYAKWTSLSHLTLILALEDEFNTQFPTDDIPDLTSVPAIVSALANRV